MKIKFKNFVRQRRLGALVSILVVSASIVLPLTLASSTHALNFLGHTDSLFMDSLGSVSDSSHQARLGKTLDSDVNVVLNIEGDSSKINPQFGGILPSTLSPTNTTGTFRESGIATIKVNPEPGYEALVTVHYKDYSYTTIYKVDEVGNQYSTFEFTEMNYLKMYGRNRTLNIDMQVQPVSDVGTITEENLGARLNYNHVETIGDYSDYLTVEYGGILKDAEYGLGSLRISKAGTGTVKTSLSSDDYSASVSAYWIEEIYSRQLKHYILPRDFVNSEHTFVMTQALADTIESKGGGNIYWEIETKSAWEDLDFEIFVVEKYDYGLGMPVDDVPKILAPSYSGVLDTDAWTIYDTIPAQVSKSGPMRINFNPVSGWSMSITIEAGGHTICTSDTYKFYSGKSYTGPTSFSALLSREDAEMVREFGDKISGDFGTYGYFNIIYNMTPEPQAHVKYMVRNTPIPTSPHSPSGKITYNKAEAGSGVYDSGSGVSETFKISQSPNLHVNALIDTDETEFTGWFDEDGNLVSTNRVFIAPTITDSEGLWEPNKTTTYYAEFKRIPVVQVDENNGSPVTPRYEVHEGDTYTVPDAPVYTGYKFINWSLTCSDKSLMSDATVNPGDTFTMPFAEVFLTANWEMLATDIKVSYDPNGAKESAPAPVEHTTGDEVTLLPSTTFTKEGYRFVKWEVKDTEGEIYTVTDNKITIKNKDITIKPLWIKCNKVTYDDSDYTFGTVPLEKIYDVGENVTFAPLDTYYKDGFRNKAWVVKDELGNTISSSVDGFTMPDKDVIVYPTWASNFHYVHYDPNGGSPTSGITVADQTVFEGDLYILLPDDTFYRDGYAFTEWTATDATGATVPVRSRTITIGTENITVKANWIPGISITYLPNGATPTDAVPAKAIVETGSEVTIADPSIFTYPDGQDFIRWIIKDSTGKDIPITDGNKIVTANKDITIKPYFGKVHTVKYSLSNIYCPPTDHVMIPTGGVPADTIYGAGEIVTLAPLDTVRSSFSSYINSSWYIVNQSTGEITIAKESDTTFTMPDADVIIYPCLRARALVSYRADGGKGSLPDDKYYYEGDTVKLEDTDIIMKVGYNNTEWRVSKDPYGTTADITVSPDGTFIMPSSPVYVYPTWVKNLSKFKVHYDGDGGTINQSLGTIINIKDDSHTWRIIAKDGNTAKLMSMENIKNMPFFKSSAWQTLFSDSKYHIQYEESDIDHILSNDFYSSLSDGLKNAMIKQTYTQKAYSTTGVEPKSGTYYTYLERYASSPYYIVDNDVKAIDSIRRNVYLLSAEDIIEYFKALEKDITYTEIWKMLWNDTNQHTSNPTLSSVSEKYSEVMQIDGIYGSFITKDPTSTSPPNEIRAVITVDTSKLELEMEPDELYDNGVLVNLKNDFNYFEKPGYGYKEWIVTRDSDSKSVVVSSLNQITMPVSDVTVKPKWIKKYEAIYDGSGATAGDTPATKEYLEGDTVTLAPLTTFKKDSLNADHWIVTDSDGNLITVSSDGKFTMPASNALIRPAWPHKVHYEGDGGTSPDDEYFAEGKTVGLKDLDIYSKDGYINAGWIVTSDADLKAITASDDGKTFVMPDSDVTVKPNWVKAVSVKWNPNGATPTAAAPSDSIVASGTVITLPDPSVYTYDGYVFDSWTIKDSDGTTITPVDGKFTTEDLDVTVTANWISLGTRALYDGDGATGGTTPEPKKYDEGETVTLEPIDTFEKDGYRPDHWIVTDGDGNPVPVEPDGTFTMPATDVVITPVWIKLITVSYDANGGTATGTAPADEEFDAGEEITVKPDDTFTYTGYRFVEWEASDADGIITIDAATGSLTARDKDIIIKAIWIKNSTATYDGDGETGGTTPEPKKYDEGETVTLEPIDTFEKDGYRPDHWIVTDGDGNPVPVEPDGTFTMPGTDVVITPEWIKLIKVSYDANGGTATGTAPADEEFDAGEEITVKPEDTFTYTGYRFVEWEASDADGTITIDAATGSLTARDKDIIIKAIWIKNSTATYDGDGATGGTTPEPKKYDEGESVTLEPIDTFEKDGYRPDHWIVTDGDGNPVPVEPDGTFIMPGTDVVITPDWVKVIKVSYDANGGTATGTAPADEVYDVGEEVTVKPEDTFTYTGYRFVEWEASDADGIITIDAATGSLTARDKDIIIKAIWIKNSTATYDGDGATGGTTPEPKKYDEGESVTLEPIDTFEKDGYRPDHWIVTDGDGNPVPVEPDGTFIMPGTDVVITPDWVKVITVSYDANGGTATGTAPADEVYDAGEEVTVKPEDTFTYTGYRFVEWEASDADGIITIDEATGKLTARDKDIIIKAIWIKNSTATYDGDGETGGTTPEPKKYDEGESVTLEPIDTFEKDGYRPDHWIVTDGDGNPVPVEPDGTFIMPGTDVVITPEWIKLITVSYDANGGTATGTAPADEVYDAGEEVTVKPEDTFTYTGYRFVEWEASDADGIITIDAATGSLTARDKDIIIKAIWIKNSTATYDGDGETGGTTPEPKKYDEGESVTLEPIDTFEKDGYRPDHWIVTDSDGNPVPVEPDGTFIMPGKDVVITPDWVRVIKVSYDANGGTATGTAPADEVYDAGSEITVKPEDTFTYTGYRFDKWTASDEDGDIPIDETSGKLTARDKDVIIKANWIKQVSIIWNPNGATPTAAAPSDSVVDTGTEITLPDPSVYTYDGHRFDGWTVKDSSSMDVTVTDEKFTAADKDITVTANWIALFKYSAIHYQQKADGTGYEPVDTVPEETVDAGTPVEIDRNTYVGFHFVDTSVYKTDGLDADTVFELYYDRNTHNISFEAGCTTYTGSMAAIIGVRYDEVYTIPECKFKRTGYEFDEWEIKTKSGSPITATGTTINMPDDDVIFTATWKATNISYTIEYHLMDLDRKGYTKVDADTLGPIEAEYDSKVDISDKVKTYPGFTAESTNVLVKDPFQTDGYVFVVKYSRNNTYKVTYDPGAADATGTMTNLSNLSFEEEVTIAKNNYKRTGYAFDGWDVVDAAGNPITPVDGRFEMPAADVTITAKWALGKLSYTIEYYQQKLGTTAGTARNYELFDTEYGSDFTDASVTVTPKAYDGFEFNSTMSNVTIDKLVDGTVFKLYYDRKLYTVKYVGGPGADGTMDSVTNIQYGQTVTLEANKFTKTDYAFDGWEATNDSDSTLVTITSGKIVMPASDVTVTATWKLDNLPYKVEHYIEKLDGGYELKETETGLTAKYGSSFEITPKSYDGFTFDAGASDYKVSGLTVEDYTFKLYYTRKAYKIVFNAGCVSYTGTMNPILDCPYESVQDIPSNRYIRTGFTFAGWEAKDADGNPVTITGDKITMPASDVTVTAKWDGAKITYYVEYYKQNLSKTGYDKVDADCLGPIEVTYEAPVDVTVLDYPGFTLNTKLSETGTTALTEDKHVFVLRYDRISTYKVTYNPGASDVSGTMTNLTGRSFEEIITIAKNNYTRPGYAFDGWDVADAAGNPITPVDSKFAMPASDVTITAKWAFGKSSYTIEYYHQKLGTVAGTASNYELYDTEYASADTESSVTISPKSFEGFAFNSTLSYVSIDKLADGTVFKLYYDRNLYTLKYVGGPGADGTMDSVTNIQYGQTVTLDANKFTKTDYAFVGWEVTNDTDTSLVPITSGKIVMPASDVTATATWRLDNLPYEVEHYIETLDGVYEIKETETGLTAKYGSSFEITPKTYTGFTFDASASDYKATDFKDADYTFKLYYKRNAYKIIFKAGCKTYTGSMAPIENCLYESSQTIPPNGFNRTGFTFTEWEAKDADGNPVTITGDKITMPASDVTVTAKWDGAKIKYYVEYYLQNKTKTGYDKLDAECYGPEEVTYEAPANAIVKSFDGYKLNTKASTPTEIASLTVDGYVFTLKYDRISNYKVTYKPGADGVTGTMTNLTNRTFGETITIASNKYKKTGYVFDGWDVVDAAGNPITPVDGKFDMPAADVIITALWKPGVLSYKVQHWTQNLDLKKYTMESEETVSDITAGTSVTIDPITIEGFTWNSAKGVYKDDDFVVDGKVFKLYYDRNKYKISYQPGDHATGTMADTTGKKFEETVTLAKSTFKADKGYVFDKWTVATDPAGDAVTVTSGKITMPASNVVATATWKAAPITYKVEHYLQNLDKTTYTIHAKSTTTVNTTYFESVTVSPKTFTGYTFDDVYTATITPELSIASFEDAGYVFKLYYKRNTYNVKYDGGAADCIGSMDGLTDVIYADKVTIDKNKFVRPNYKFSSWVVTKDTDGSVVTPTKGVFNMPASDVTITAKWVETRYKWTTTHWIRTVDGTGFEIYKTEQKSDARDGDVVTAKPLTITGIEYIPGLDDGTYVEKLSDTVRYDYSPKLNLYYERYKYKIYYISSDAQASGDPYCEEYYFNEPVTMPENCFVLQDMYYAGWHVNRYDSLVDGVFDIPVRSTRAKDTLFAISDRSVNKLHADSSIDVVLDPGDVLRMPAYDIKAASLWTDKISEASIAPKDVTPFAIDTGDSNPIYLYIVLLLSSGLFVVLIINRNKKTNN